MNERDVALLFVLVGATVALVAAALLFGRQAQIGALGAGVGFMALGLLRLAAGASRR